MKEPREIARRNRIKGKINLFLFLFLKWH